MTMPTRAVLDLLMQADPDDAPWGYRIHELTGLGPGTIYPILDRLERAKWINGEWEEPEPVDRPRRRLYKVTAHGRAEYQKAAMKTPARTRMFGWITPEGARS